MFSEMKDGFVMFPGMKEVNNILEDFCVHLLLNV